MNFYKNLFSEGPSNTDFRALNYIEICITDDDNIRISAIPTLQEVTKIILSIDANSSPGPDGLSGMFYHKCWDIIAEDMHNAVKAIFSGSTLTKFYTHTYIVMIPKVDHPQSFSYLGPISLCNVSSKIISKILNARLSSILPRIISRNQSGFIKGRTILENILLAQEIISDINKPNRGGNIVLKLDMTKAYDRVSWIFLRKVLKKMGFSDQWIEIIH